ncbi:MAG TPA: GNAT family N-acetyltransferase [Anaerolineales bacterium]|nr:GNAT family N-acetyltransferase [Anaerolineales bacterium]
MTAAALSRSPRRRSGLRPVHPGRDMGDVADLIDMAFAGQLDATARRMVREMRAFGRAGWLGWLFARLLLPPAAHPHGFVWETDGKLVGNASLLRVTSYPRRWVVANVAVHPQYRRQGIARAMLSAAIEWTRERHAQTVLLQAKGADLGAQVLYASLGFQPLTTRTTWFRSSGAPPSHADAQDVARRRMTAEWQEQLALAARIHPEGLIWPFPLQASLFRPSSFGSLLKLEQDRHWVWPEGDRLLGSLTARSGREQGGWRLLLIVEPEARGTVEGPLLSLALRDLPGPVADARLDYPAGLSENALRAHGFVPEHTLTWMAVEFEDEVV